jgi:hypothetical protein
MTCHCHELPSGETKAPCLLDFRSMGNRFTKGSVHGVVTNNTTVERDGTRPAQDATPKEEHPSAANPLAATLTCSSQTSRWRAEGRSVDAATRTLSMAGAASRRTRLVEEATSSGEFSAAKQGHGGEAMQGDWETAGECAAEGRANAEGGAALGAVEERRAKLVEGARTVEAGGPHAQGRTVVYEGKRGEVEKAARFGCVKVGGCDYEAAADDEGSDSEDDVFELRICGDAAQRAEMLTSLPGYMALRRVVVEGLVEGEAQTLAAMLRQCRRVTEVQIAGPVLSVSSDDVTLASRCQV